MLVRRKDNPSKWEWKNEKFLGPHLCCVYREEEGVYEVYHNHILIGTADNENEVDEIINNYERTA